MAQLTHIDEQGKIFMVDVGDKTPQVRTAIAEGCIELQETTLKLIIDNQIKKGDVLTTAKIAGIQAAKQTSNLIPLCHPLLTDKVSVETEICNNSVKATSLVRCTGKTGVEMEALTAVSVALLTIYDMCKAVDKDMRIGEVHLLSKTKSDAL
jgi:cyclic pyranopterin monophosphate synthase